MIKKTMGFGILTIKTFSFPPYPKNIKISITQTRNEFFYIFS